MDQATHQPPLISNTALISEREKTKTFKLFKTGFWYIIGKPTLSPAIISTLKEQPIQNKNLTPSKLIIDLPLCRWILEDGANCLREGLSIESLACGCVPDYKWWRLINFMSDSQRVPLFGGILPMAVTDVRNKIQT